MKISKFSLIVILILSHGFTNGQKKTASKPRQIHLEIDALARRYQDGESIVLSSPNASLTVQVSISYNDSGEPYAIVFNGEDSCVSLNCFFRSSTSSLPSIEDLFESLKRQKTAKGYRYSETLSKYSNAVYTKGNMYTRFEPGFLCCSLPDEGNFRSKQKFKVTTVDYSRSQKAGSADFEF